MNIKVKDLEWAFEQSADGTISGECRFNLINGIDAMYFVCKHGASVSVTFFIIGRGVEELEIEIFRFDSSSLEEAKAAANEHFEKFVTGLIDRYCTVGGES